jgi:hypothetical protein
MGSRVEEAETRRLSSDGSQLDSTCAPGTLWASSQACLEVRHQPLQKRVLPPHSLRGVAAQVACEQRNHEYQVFTYVIVSRVDARRFQAMGQLDATCTAPTVSRTRQQCLLARVTASFIRRTSDRKLTSPFGLLRTAEITMASFSLPWNPSTAL